MNPAERIGWTSPPSEVRIDHWQVRLFCHAIGEDAPREGEPLPPTFLKAVETEHFSSAALLQALQLPMRGVLHAEQSFEHFAPLHVGETVRVQRRLSDVQVKKGGAMTFLVVDSDYHRGDEHVASSRQTILVRRLEPA